MPSKKKRRVKSDVRRGTPIVGGSQLVCQQTSANKDPLRCLQNRDIRLLSGYAPFFNSGDRLFAFCAGKQVYERLLRFIRVPYRKLTTSTGSVPSPWLAKAAKGQGCLNEDRVYKPGSLNLDRFAYLIESPMRFVALSYFFFLTFRSLFVSVSTGAELRTVRVFGHSLESPAWQRGSTLWPKASSRCLRANMPANYNEKCRPQRKPFRERQSDARFVRVSYTAMRGHKMGC